jgi:hypothetical protein
MTMDPGALERPPVEASEPARRGSLLGNLTTWQVLGLSIGLMGLSLSANIDPQGAVPVVGRAIPLSFAIATVGVLPTRRTDSCTRMKRCGRSRSAGSKHALSRALQWERRVPGGGPRSAVGHRRR